MRRLIFIEKAGVLKKPKQKEVDTRYTTFTTPRTGNRCFYGYITLSLRHPEPLNPHGAHDLGRAAVTKGRSLALGEPHATRPPNLLQRCARSLRGPPTNELGQHRAPVPTLPNASDCPLSTSISKKNICAPPQSFPAGRGQPPAETRCWKYSNRNTSLGILLYSPYPQRPFLFAARHARAAQAAWVGYLLTAA